MKNIWPLILLGGVVYYLYTQRHKVAAIEREEKKIKEEQKKQPKPPLVYLNETPRYKVVIWKSPKDGKWYGLKYFDKKYGQYILGVEYNLPAEIREGLAIRLIKAIGRKEYEKVRRILDRLKTEFPKWAYPVTTQIAKLTGGGVLTA